MAFEPDYRGYDDGWSDGLDYRDRLIADLKKLRVDVDGMTKAEIKEQLDKIIRGEGRRPQGDKS